MNIIINTREHTPSASPPSNARYWRGCSPQTISPCRAHGPDRCTVERKSLNNPQGCLTGEGRERFKRELARAHGLDAFAVVIEATMLDIAEGRYRLRMKPPAALQSILAFQVRGCPSFCCATSPAKPRSGFGPC